MIDNAKKLIVNTITVDEVKELIKEYAGQGGSGSSSLVELTTEELRNLEEGSLIFIKYIDEGDGSFSFANGIITVSGEEGIVISTSLLVLETIDDTYTQKVCAHINISEEGTITCQGLEFDAIQLYEEDRFSFYKLG